jgi:hypothetical protein
MLPKPEKGKKLNNNFLSDSEITKESEEVVNAKKVKSKRRLILISLIATAGLSFIFWSIKGIQSFINSPHSLNLNFNFDFKMPSFNFSTSNKNSTDISNTDLDKFLSQKNWSAIILKNGDLSSLFYQYNFPNPNIDDFISELSNIKPSENSPIASNLPQGLILQEKLNDSLYGLNINLPNNQLTFIIKDNSNSDNFSQNISSFINQAYWYSISQD